MAFVDRRGVLGAREVVNDFLTLAPLVVGKEFPEPYCERILLPIRL